MVASRTQIGLVAGVFIFLGLGLTLYKVSLGFPLVPGEYREVWTIESKVNFKPTDGPAEVELKLPGAIAGWTILEENFSSSGFGFSILEEGSARKARWTRQLQERPTTLYYKIQAYQASNADLPSDPAIVVEKPLLEADQEAAVNRLIEVLRLRSSGVESFTIQLLQEFSREQLDQDVEFLLSTFQDSAQSNSFSVMLDILAQAGIPARRLRGIELEDGRRRQLLSSLLEVHNGKSWVVFNPADAIEGIPPNFFVWQRGNEAVLDVVGGVDSSLEFALVSNRLPAKAVAGLNYDTEGYSLLDFSIYSLPVEQQGIFKGLLLIPVAALVVVIMRVLVGVKTSGTFMPILIALAFIQTTLLVGLAIFLLLVGVGLWIRSYLSHMNLLLVSRIAAVVIVVILLMAVLAVISYKLGLERALTVTFFPTVILAWTIERMSILWEEEGGHEVFIQGSGSLLVAVLAYMAMSIRLVEHLTFNFPELMFCLLGVILLLGKYTGYRLSELYRFRDLANKQ